MTRAIIPFNKPYISGVEIQYIKELMQVGHLSGDGAFTKKCHARLEQIFQVKKALLTHSCTAALEMAAILLDIQPGDEVIMPSYTFVSTANAFVMRGAVPVFVDIRLDTLNIDENLIEAAITKKTKAIVVVHYAGTACEMDSIMKIAENNNLLVVEDAAQAFGSTYKGRPLGSIGHLGTLSFHETKNIHCGEGGAILLNDENFILRAEIIREKGTNRTQFHKGQVDKYTWVDIGSSYLPSEINAAFLLAQLEAYQKINEERMALWNRYESAFASNQKFNTFSRSSTHGDNAGNGHIYYLVTKDSNDRDKYIEAMNRKGISTVFHYVPLHSSPFGIAHSRVCGRMENTDKVSKSIVRLPIWVGLGPSQKKIIDETNLFFSTSII